MLAAINPSEAVVEVGSSSDLSTTFRHTCANISIEKVNTKETLPKSTAIDASHRSSMERPGAFNPWDEATCVRDLKRKKYFPASSKDPNAEETMGRWPAVLKACIDGGANLALSALGAGVFYLQRALVDYEIMSMAEIRAYVPPVTTGADTTTSLNKQGNDKLHRLSQEREIIEDGLGEVAEVEHMSLDGITLENLEILVNLSDGKVKGSLWSKINRTKTPHGARLLKGWLLRPLFKKPDIDRRACAVTEIATGAPALAMTEARAVLKKVGDLERLLSRVHSMGNVEAGHPINRQVLYEGKTHTKRKVKDFSGLLSGLKMVERVGTIFEDTEVRSPLLLKVMKKQSSGGLFPDMRELLQWFVDNFDVEKAKDGAFTPIRGMEEKYDQAVDDVEACKVELARLQDEYCATVKGSRGHFKYVNIRPDSKDKYLIELPVHVKVPSTFIVKGKRGSGNKQVNKYYTQEVEEVVGRLNDAYAREADGRADGLAAIFRKFDSHRNVWNVAVMVSGMLDALSSLAEVSGQPGWSQPTILEPSAGNTGCLSIKGGVHPCVDTTHSGDDFVPNDMTIGGSTPRVLLLSGPNMGGKSTLLRQTCLISILGQMGCHVPAFGAEICPVDRIFTRLGASDKLLEGQSTFFVELSETAAALRGATSRSLVIMDELGRGTSTFDGTAIAHAVIKHLVEDCRCLTMFATHYHSLLADWSGEDCVKLGHMKCFVEDQKNITFLYQLGDGPCPKVREEEKRHYSFHPGKTSSLSHPYPYNLFLTHIYIPRSHARAPYIQSFGINVARLAGIPEEVLEIAGKKSEEFGEEMRQRELSNSVRASGHKLLKRLREAASKEDAEKVRAIVAEIQRGL